MSQHSQTNMLKMKLFEIADYCKNIEKLLKRDLESFKKNNIKEFILNSENEINEIEKITSVIESIKSSYQTKKSDDLASIIKEHISKLDQKTQNEIKATLKEIANNALNCYNIISSNNQIVFHNALQLKILFSSIIESQSGSNGLYNGNGKLNSDSK